MTAKDVYTIVNATTPYTAGSGGDGGPATSAELSYPYGIAVDSSGNLYIGDTPASRCGSP